MLFLWGYIHKLGAISIFSIDVWAMLGILLSTPLNISGVFYSYLTVHQGQLTINFDQIVVANEVLIFFQVNTEKKWKNVFLVMQLLYIMRHKETNTTFSSYDCSYIDYSADVRLFSYLSIVFFPSPALLWKKF